MEKACLIGERLVHSYSAIIHNKLGYRYDLVPLAPDKVGEFVRAGEYNCFNVTIPYKKFVMEFLDEVSDEAIAIGSVNTVVRRGGKLFGFNTDIFGFDYMFKKSGVSVEDKKVLILGSGGTGVMAKYYAERENAAEVVVISREGKDNYLNISEHYDSDIIINATPVGMYPDNGKSPIDLFRFERAQFVLDVIYNPLMTKLLLDAKLKKIKYQSGLLMLVAQAVYAKALFFNVKPNLDETNKVYSTLKSDTANIVLIGMPSAGKTTVGRALSERLGRPFVDTDLMVEQKLKKSIPSIFSEYGEAYFRAAETEAMAEVGKERGQVISVGGGAVTNVGAYGLLKQNGVIIYLKRCQNKADFVGRPLLSDKVAYEKLFFDREPIYNSFADFTVDNDGDLSETVDCIVEKL